MYFERLTKEKKLLFKFPKNSDFSFIINSIVIGLHSLNKKAPLIQDFFNSIRTFLLLLLNNFLYPCSGFNKIDAIWKIT